MRAWCRRGRTAQAIVVAVFTAATVTLFQQPVVAQEVSVSQNPSSTPVRVAQQVDSTSEKQGPPASGQQAPVGISLEDLLLQKGTITKEEWLRIRSEQEYKAVDQTRRLENLEDWKGKTEVLPILKDKVNVGLNALQFLYGHVNANVPEGKSQDSFSVRRAELVFGEN
ncbi:MAG: hypothetical protein IPK92_19020 [Nitrospira sp.]|nr:hypothetical protein [Nitrospira sp.]